MNTNPTPDTVTEATLDCSGLLCPLPVYRAALVLKRMGSGERLRLTTTDPGALEDIPAMARQRGDRVVSSTADDTKQVFVIEKGSQQ